MPINLYNPLDDLICAAINLYPKLDCYIQFDDVQDAKGMTFFPSDGSRPVICIDIRNNMIQCLDVLCHELAHAVLGENHTEHDKKWEDVQESIYNEYERLIEMRSSKDAGSVMSFLP